MQDPHLSQRISKIETEWSRLFPAGGDGQRLGMDPALVLRYHAAVYRYLLAITGDPNLADELVQEFAVRFLAGKYSNVAKEKGRFRHYLKAAVRNLVKDHFRNQPPPPMENATEPDRADPEPAGEFEGAFREAVLAKAMEEMAAEQRQTGQPFHTVLLYKIDHPDLTTEQLAEALAAPLGKRHSQEAMRQTLHRAREKYAELLLQEVARAAGTSDPDRLGEELAELDLLVYCKSALKKRQRE